MARCAAGVGEFGHETGNPSVEHGEPLHAGLAGQGTDQKRLAHTGLAAGAQVMNVPDPFAGCGPGQEGSGDAAPLAAIDILHVRPDAQLRPAQMGEIAGLVAVGEFPLQQHGEPVVEAGLVGIGDSLQVIHGVCHALQAELQHALDVRPSQGQGRSPLPVPDRHGTRPVREHCGGREWDLRFRCVLRSGASLAQELAAHRGGTQPATGQAAGTGGSMLPGEIDHAPNRAEGVRGEPLRSQAAPSPFQRLRPDAPRPPEKAGAGRPGEPPPGGPVPGSAAATDARGTAWLQLGYILMDTATARRDCKDCKARPLPGGTATVRAPARTYTLGPERAGGTESWFRSNSTGSFAHTTRCTHSPPLPGHLRQQPGKRSIILEPWSPAQPPGRHRAVVERLQLLEDRPLHRSFENNGMACSGSRIRCSTARTVDSTSVRWCMLPFRAETAGA